MHNVDKVSLDKIYRQYNKKEFIHPDPLEFLYNYKKIYDREVIGLIASSLAYGKVAQILRSVKKITDILGPHPKNFIISTDLNIIKKSFNGFKHRFTNESDIINFIIGIKKILLNHGSLYNCFKKGYCDSDENIFNALNLFVRQLIKDNRFNNSMLIPDPEKGSACKRLNLFLRWMIRKDDVDPGGWDLIPLSKLIIPLDTHMHRFGLIFGFTKRKNGDIKTAIEITNGFKKISPGDPVKYDFSITRFGIRNELSFNNLRDVMGMKN